MASTSLPTSGGGSASFASAPPRARVIAFYLPQYHPIPENDRWWGKGFTEWVNVAKARPLYPGHYQPREPAELGYYDLRQPAVRGAQADMARRHGIEGFCYWHYWFGNGRRLLDRPFREVLQTGDPDFPFCLAWANQSWTGIWHGAPYRMLMEQTYPGVADYRAHFDAVRPAFDDHRYLRVHGKPIFVVFDATALPDAVEFVECWRECAHQAGVGDLHLVEIRNPARVATPSCFDACVPDTLALMRRALHARESRLATLQRRVRRVLPALAWRPTVYAYDEAIAAMSWTAPVCTVSYPCVLPNWDNTPRSGKRGVVLHGSTPALFGRHLEDALQQVQGYGAEQRIIFVKSWNEWAEGNYLEPDRGFGLGYLDAVAKVILGARITSR